MFGIDLGRAVQSHGLHIMIGGIILFAVLMAIPFVPGIEISVALLALFGANIAIAIYAATVAALALSWLVGRLLPISSISPVFDAVGLHQARDLVWKLRPLNAEKRFEMLIHHAPKRIIPTLLNHRYLAVMVALNVPGNALIGGGGGIALLAGMSGLFSFPRFLIAVALAALPVPLFIIVTDIMSAT